MKDELLEYLMQDVRLLGGIMRKAQDICWEMYHIDIVNKLTLSSLALTIFRMEYYDDSTWKIHIPSRNEESFIRRAYYGGHLDVSKPVGENLYYYHVNSPLRAFQKIRYNSFYYFLKKEFAYLVC